MSEKHEVDCLCIRCALDHAEREADKGASSFAAPAGWKALADKLAQPDLTSDDLMMVEALAWRASKAKCAEVESACVTVICALQGYYGKPSNDD